MKKVKIQRRDKYYMDLAFGVSSASKCQRAKYGCVITDKFDRVVSTGYNGKPPNSICDDICFREGLDANSPKDNCCLHSEANALMYSDVALRRGGAIYVSGVPCNDCALLIMASGVTRLVYFACANDIDYWRDSDGVAHFKLIKNHKGSMDDDYIDRYGTNIEVTRFNFADWNEMYGPHKK